MLKEVGEMDAGEEAKRYLYYQHDYFTDGKEISLSCKMEESHLFHN